MFKTPVRRVLDIARNTRAAGKEPRYPAAAAAGFRSLSDASLETTACESEGTPRYSVHACPVQRHLAIFPLVSVSCRSTMRSSVSGTAICGKAIRNYPPANLRAYRQLYSEFGAIEEFPSPRSSRDRSAFLTLLFCPFQTNRLAFVRTVLPHRGSLACARFRTTAAFV